MQLADLLATASLDLRLLVGGTDTDVRWVATSELDDPTAFLEGGELLLTTGLRTPRGGWGPWIARLAEARAAAVGFGVGLSHPRVPRTLIAAARAHGLPVVEVPQPTPFIAISRRLADLLRRSENEAEASAARAQRDLTAAATLGVDAVLHRLGRAAAGSAWLLGPSGRLLAGSPPPPERARLGLERLRHQGPHASWSDVGDDVLTLLPAGPERWLLVAAPTDAPRALRATIGTAAALLAVLGTNGPTDDLVPLLVDLVVNGQIERAHRLARALALMLPDPARVLRWSGTAPGDALVGEAFALTTSVPEQGRVGVGPLLPLDRAPESAAAATHAYARTAHDRPVVHARADAFPDVPGLEAWAARRLVALSPDLRETVHTFLAHHGSRRTTAESLGLHRNTIRQRLDRAAALLEVSWDSPTDRAELWLALTAASTGRDR